MIEIWRAVPGYEGLYKVSSEGRVKRCDKYPGHVLKFGHNKQGRRQVTLCRDGVAIKYQVHRLVLEAFVGSCPPGLECRHGDGDHLNNRLGNLCWGTHTQNMQDKIAHGTSGKGEANPHAKLCEDDIRAIRMSPHTQRALGKAYGVSQVAIQAVQKRRTWAHVV
ncbi:NUMOD4 motif-containing HNH endonuclease [Caballeronia sp. LjRoot31]|uniref:NUMOD4 motif-containing HNH endonuclease n=1 Tax=Caballeronia sp. LjRoot31 TaxID=3342324 RepID=UPI003ECDAB11